MCMLVKSKKETSEHSMWDLFKMLIIGLLKCIIVQVHILFDWFVDLVFGLYYDSKAKKVSPVSDLDLLDSAVNIADKIRARTVTSEEVVTKFIDRCKEINHLINAVVVERYEAAIEEAKEVDKLIRECGDPEIFKKTKPFLGVPFTTKESNEAKGLLHTMGMLCREGHCSSEDATVVGYVRASGAILIAKTNIPEMNLWVESRNLVYGQTNNPYNTTRTVGGSSGGEGAIITACGAAFSIGSDIGGSSRIPAFANGVFGFKPSEGMTPMKGIGLRQKDWMDTMAEAGPICKKADDLIPLLKIFVGDKVSKLKLDTPVDVTKLNVFYQESSGDMRASRISSTVHEAFIKVVRHFRRTTGAVIKIKIPGTEYSYKLWRYWMTQEETDFKLDITNKQYRTSALAEVSKLIQGKSEITLAAMLKLADEDVFPKENPEWAKTTTANMKKYLLNKLGDDGVLLYPSSPLPPMYHYASYLRPYNFGYFCLFNVLRLPVCQVPLGVDSQGLPLGIQVVAAPYNDHLCVAVAKDIEKAFGGWVQPGTV